MARARSLATGSQPARAFSAELAPRLRAPGWAQISPLWLAAALALTISTSLRASSVPVGPGELMLVFWMAATLLSRRELPEQPEERRVARWITLFWYFLIFLMLAGSAYSYIRGLDQSASFHTFTAMLLSAAFSISLAWSHPTPAFLMKTWKWLLWLAVLFPLVYLITSGPDLGEFFSSTSRFQGISNNPNQLGLLLAPVPFLIVFFLRSAVPLRTKAFSLLLIVPAGLLGYSTKSDALIIGWGVGLVFLAVLAGTPRIRIPLIGRLLYKLVLLLALVLILALVLRPWLDQVYAQQDQGDVRVTLMENGLRAVLLSPLIGLGAGSHSGVHGPLEGMESHNSLIDLAMAGGLLAAVLAIVLSTQILLTLFSERRWVLTALVVSLLAFSAFHNTLRQPLFWFFVFSAWMMAAFSEEGQLTEQPQGMESSKAGSAAFGQIEFWREPGSETRY